MTQKNDKPQPPPVKKPIPTDIGQSRAGGSRPKPTTGNNDGRSNQRK